MSQIFNFVSSALSTVAKIKAGVVVGTATLASTVTAAAAYYSYRKFSVKRNKAKAEQKIDVFKELNDAFPAIVKDFCEYLETELKMPQHIVKRTQRMLEYNVSGGKLYRGDLVVTTVQTLCKAYGFNFEQLKNPAIVIGWCIEALQAAFLVSDDIMDKSLTRRGQPCWYQLADVQMDAVNDALVLESLLYFLLKKHIGQNASLSSAYSSLVDLFHRVSLDTQMGQMLDLTAQPLGRKDPAILKNFTQDTYTQIVRFKTAYYTFYLPVASALILCGMGDTKRLTVARNIAEQLGEMFQAQDDILDCYGKPEVIGKVGTDIQDHKCTWLLMMALQIATPEQRAVIEANLGREEPEHVAAIKQLYETLDLKSTFTRLETESFERISKLIADNASMLPEDVYRSILNKIYRRQK